MQRVAILGATGSIGTSSLDVIAALPDRLTVTALVAGRSWESLARQCHQFRPRVAVLSDSSLRNQVPRDAFPRETQLEFGAEAVARAAAADDVDVVVSEIVGAAGLAGTWAAIEARKKVCLANKETLVVAGPLVMDLAKRTGAVLVPVDSEHGAVFQALQCGREMDVARLILTASGGPFRKFTRTQLESVTKDQALAHPNWKMGPKITIDSATMMNKALEVIEARWLFNMPVEKIGVVVHPQSVIHSLVEFHDGSVIAQLSPPDMRLPIQYALLFPERPAGPARRMDWSLVHTLEMFPADVELFPALGLGFEVAARGGTAGAVLNAANEVAVERFLNDTLRFVDIPRAVAAVLSAHTFDPHPTLSDLKRLDRWAREETARWNS